MVVNIKSFIFHLIHLNIFNASLYFKILIFTMSKVHLLYYFNKMKNFRCLIMLEIFSPTNLLCAIQAKMFEDFTPREAQTYIPGYLCKNIYSNCPSEWVNNLCRLWIAIIRKQCIITQQ